MVSSEVDSFPLINGRLSIRDTTIFLTSDTASSLIDRVFGRNRQRRSFVFAVIFGFPLGVTAAVLINNGHIHAAVYPAFFATLFLTSPLFYFGTSHPDQIPINDIQAVIGHPPKKHRSLGHFTIHFMLNDTRTRTSIALPCTHSEEQMALFQHAVSVLDRAGIAVVDTSNKPA